MSVEVLAPPADAIAPQTPRPSLAETHPEVADQWDTEANGDLTPQDVTAGSKKKAHWVCARDQRHRWAAVVKSRALSGSGCPVCSGYKVVPGLNDLATLHPEIAAQWDTGANGALRTDCVYASSSRQAHWICSSDSRHRWVATVTSRTVRATGCPVCASKRALVGVNDLATLHPEIAAQWDSEANGSLTPQDVTPGSSKQAHWVCAKDERHRWVADVARRTSRQSGCPVCSGHKVVPGLNDLATSHPEIAAEWDVEANGDLTPQDVTRGSKKKAHWVCAADARHRWVATANIRTSNQSGCPVCSGHKVVPGLNDLATLYPAIAAQWDTEANGDLTPQDVTPGSSKHVHWMCEKDTRHRWTAPVLYRTKRGLGCSVCSGRQIVVGVNDLATSHPEVAAQWDAADNGTLTPQDVTPGSSKKAHWVCAADVRHRWVATVASRALGGHGCPVCSGYMTLAGVNDLATLRPEIAAEWDVEANGDLTPQDVPIGSGTKVHWVCVESIDHRWMATVGDRTLRESGCPICANKRVLAGFNDLATSHPEMAARWDAEANGTLTPQDVTSGSSKKAHWMCAAVPLHRWEASIVDVSSARSGCPICSNRKVMVGVNDLPTSHPNLAAEWDTEANGGLRPEQFSRGSSARVSWVCARNTDHRWTAAIGDRTAGTGCPLCGQSSVSAAETDLADTLANLVPDVTLVRSDRATLPGRFELDIHFPDAAFAVEFNGLYWHSDANGTAPDYHAKKSQAARAVGLQLIHVWQDDWRDRRTIVLRSILTKLGALDSAAAIAPELAPFARRVNARSCTVSVVDRSESSAFLSEHHIQGPKGGSVRLGLRDRDGALVALLVASVSGERATIERFATSCVVRGGFSRLEKALLGELPASVSTLVTFADAAVSDAGLYENNGWVLDGEIPPDYSYVVRDSRVHKFNYRLKRFREDPALEYVEGMTERELAALNGLSRIWDAGKTRWVKPVSVSATASTLISAPAAPDDLGLAA